MKKKAEKKNKNFEFGQVMSLLESMDGGIKVISEQHGDIMKKLKEHDEKLDRIQSDVVEIKHKLSEKVDLADFQKLEKRMIKLERLVFANA